MERELMDKFRLYAEPHTSDVPFVVRLVVAVDSSMLVMEPPAQEHTLKLRIFLVVMQFGELPQFIVSGCLRPSIERIRRESREERQQEEGDEP